MPDFLEKRRRRWYGKVEIPKALRPHFNRVRFIKSLDTESLTVAKVRVLPFVIECKRAIAIAKGGGTGTDDEILATIMKVRRDAQRLKGKGTSDADTKEIHEDVAYSRSWDGELGEFVTDDEALADAVSVSLLMNVPLSSPLFIQTYLQLSVVRVFGTNGSLI